MTGVVDFFDRYSGFGQIVGADCRKYRLHRKALVGGRELKTGDRVDFRPIDHPRGPRAIEVRLVESAPRGGCS